MDIYDPEVHQFCSEFYTVEHTIDVVANYRGGAEHFRLEAVRKSTGDYRVRAYMEQNIVIEQLGNRNDSIELGKTQAKVWVDFELPPILSAKTAEQALGQSLGWLRERCGT